MSSLSQDPGSLITGRPIRKGYDRIATAHLLEADFLGSVEVIMEQVGVMSRTVCARLSAEAVSLRARLLGMADTVPLWALQQEAGLGVAGLEAIGNAALEKIHIMTVGASLRMQITAGSAADALRASSGAESGLAVTVVLDAADRSSQTLWRTWMVTRRDIQAALRNTSHKIDGIAGKSNVQQAEGE